MKGMVREKGILPERSEWFRSMELCVQDRKKSKRWYWILLGQLLCIGLLVIILPFMDRLRFRDTKARADAFLQQGKAYFQNAKYREAIIDWKNAIQLDPTDAQAHYYLGLAYLEMQLWPNALAELLQSVELAPHLTEAQLKLGELYFLSKNLVQARAKAQRVLEEDATQVQGYL